MFNNIYLFIPQVTTGELTATSDTEEAELEALASLHDACKCNGHADKVAADDINLDDTKESMDLLNDSSETRPVDDKPVEDDDCLLNVLSFCVTCCECVISWEFEKSSVQAAAGGVRKYGEIFGVCV